VKREIVVTVVCSDKGQHDPPRVLGKVEMGMVGPAVVANFTRRPEDPFGPHDEQYTAFRDGPTGPHMTDQFRCHKCGRDVPIRRDKLEAIARTLHENGHHRLDLSEMAAILGDQ
jgi:hypothetical protein